MLVSLTILGRRASQPTVLNDGFGPRVEIHFEPHLFGISRVLVASDLKESRHVQT